MLFTIRNQNYSATISALGAELKSLKDPRSGEEFIWQGDPGIWKGSAPVLFPIVGRLKDGMYVLDGVEYNMPKHGLARSRKFTLWRDGENEKCFVLRSDTDTKQHYPFDFEFFVTFGLESSTLSVSYTVRNTGAGNMYFTLGSHPAFSLPLERAALEDYTIEFGKNETLDRYFLDNGLLCTSPQPRYLDNERSIRITQDLFNNDALIFKDIVSRKIDLAHKQDGIRITLDTGGAPHLGIWAKPGAPFVCIEPWFGHDDPVDATFEFSRKNGIMTLSGGSEFRAGYQISPRGPCR
jgi:galactose mutarotase-like enzyme